MNNLWFNILLIVITGILLTLLSRETFINPDISAKTYKGICLFDIDGTLTTGINNYKSVDICLRAGYAVGISTAGSVYTSKNIKNFYWMPDNLYTFMRDRNFDTFNNVGSGVLGGVYNPKAYKNIKDLYNDQHIVWGLLKGLSLENTANKYKIKDPKKMIMFDNDPSFLKGLSIYNSNFTLICAGSPCGIKMSPETVSYALDNSIISL
jgi:hypothetical protein